MCFEECNQTLNKICLYVQDEVRNCRRYFCFSDNHLVERECKYGKIYVLSNLNNYIDTVKWLSGFAKKVQRLKNRGK